MNPVNWVWTIFDNRLVPVTTDLEQAPELLKITRRISACGNCHKSEYMNTQLIPCEADDRWSDDRTTGEFLAGLSLL
jgi:hypothetical protein